MNANGLRKKLMKGLVIDKWDLVKIIESQEKRIAELEKEINIIRFEDLGDDK